MTGLSLHLAMNCPGSGTPGEIVSRTIRLQTTLQKHQDRLSLAFAGVLCSFQINRQIRTLSQVSRLLAFTPSTTAHVFERLRNIKSTMTKQPPTTPTKPLITRDFNHSQTRSSSKDLSSQFQPLQQALHHVNRSGHTCAYRTTTDLAHMRIQDLAHMHIQDLAHPKRPWPCLHSRHTRQASPSKHKAIH